MQHVRPKMWKSGAWALLHDNAPAHSSIIVAQFLAEKKELSYFTIHPILLARFVPSRLLPVFKIESGTENDTIWVHGRH